jgi:transposase
MFRQPGLSTMLAAPELWGREVQMARTAGRLRQVAKRGYWRESDARVLIEAWRASGESLTRFGGRYGGAPRRLARWRKRLEETAAPVLHPVRVVEQVTGTRGEAIELRLADDCRVVVPAGFATDDLRRVLAVLAESLPC